MCFKEKVNNKYRGKVTIARLFLVFILYYVKMLVEKENL